MPDPLFQLSSFAQATGLSIAELLTEAFTDYVAGPVHVASKKGEAILSTGSIDEEASLVATAEGRPVGFCLVGRCRGHARLGTMGIIPGWRCRGIGKAMLLQLIAEARQRGDRSLSLEVFERNLPAVALYEHAGFQNKGRLRGWRLGDTPSLAAGASAATEISREEFCEMKKVADFPELPWLLSPSGVARLQGDVRFFREGDTALALTGLAGDQVQLRGLAAPHATATPNELETLLYTLIRAFPAKAWQAPAFWPEEHAPAFEANGFSPDLLTQLHMRLTLA